MKVGGSGDDSWNIEAEKLGAYSGKEIKDRLEKGVVVSLKNQTTGVTKRIKLEVFSQKAAKRADGEYWEKLAGRVNEVVESFFEDVVNNGLLSPLLRGDVDMGELDKSIKALTIDFNIRDDGSLKKAKHEYYDHKRSDAISIEERANIEGPKKEEYQKASQELHKSDASLDLSNMERSASKLKELVCDKDPFELRLKDKVIELFRPEREGSALVDLLSNPPISKESLLTRLNNAFTKLELGDQDDPVGFLVELAGKHLESPDDLLYAKDLLAEIATRLALLPSADFSEAVNTLCALEDVKDIFSGRLREILEGSLAGLKEEEGQEYTEVAETISEFKGLADKYNLEELKDFTIDQHLEAFKTLDGSTISHLQSFINNNPSIRTNSVQLEQFSALLFDKIKEEAHHNLDFSDPKNISQIDETVVTDAAHLSEAYLAARTFAKAHPERVTSENKLVLAQLSARVFVRDDVRSGVVSKVSGATRKTIDAEAKGYIRSGFESREDCGQLCEVLGWLGKDLGNILDEIYLDVSATTEEEDRANFLFGTDKQASLLQQALLADRSSLEANINGLITEKLGASNPLEGKNYLTYLSEQLDELSEGGHLSEEQKIGFTHDLVELFKAYATSSNEEERAVREEDVLATIYSHSEGHEEEVFSNLLDITYEGETAGRKTMDLAFEISNEVLHRDNLSKEFHLKLIDNLDAEPAILPSWDLASFQNQLLSLSKVYKSKGLREDFLEAVKPRLNQALERNLQASIAIFRSSDKGDREVLTFKQSLKKALKSGFSEKYCEVLKNEISAIKRASRDEGGGEAAANSFLVDILYLLPELELAEEEKSLLYNSLEEEVRDLLKNSLTLLAVFREDNEQMKAQLNRLPAAILNFIDLNPSVLDRKSLVREQFRSLFVRGYQKLHGTNDQWKSGIWRVIGTDSELQSFLKEDLRGSMASDPVFNEVFHDGASAVLSIQKLLPFSFDKIPTKSDSFREFASLHLNKSGTIDSLITHWDSLKDDKNVKEFVLQFLSIDEKKYTGFGVTDAPDCLSESGFSGNYRELVVELKKLFTEKVREQCGGDLSNLDNYLDGLSLPGISKGQLIKVLFAKESQKQKLSKALNIASQLLGHAEAVKSLIDFDILQNEESKKSGMEVLESSINDAKKQKKEALAFLELCSEVGSEDKLTAADFNEVLDSLASASPAIEPEQIAALRELKASIAADADPINFLKEQVNSSLRFTEEMAEGDEALEALLPHLDALDLLEINQLKERWSQTGLINAKRHKVEDGEARTEEGDHYRSYIQKAAAFLQVYKKARRGDLVLNDAELLALEQKLQGLQGNFAADLKSGALNALLEEGELSFFNSLFTGKDYKLSYPASLSKEVQLVKDRRNSTFSALNSARGRITGLATGELHPYETLGNGACGINAFIYDIIGLVHQGRYNESDLIEKLAKVPEGKDKYEELRGKYTTPGGQPFNKLFADGTLSKRELDIATREIELALEPFFRQIIVNSLLPKEGLEDVNGFDVHPGSTEVNLEFNEHVSISKGDSLAVLHQYLYVDFMRGVYQAAGVDYRRDRNSPKSDFFNYCPSLPGKAVIKGGEFYAALPQAIKDKLESSEDKAAILDKCIREGFTGSLEEYEGDLANEWKGFLKDSLKTYVDKSVAPLRRWIGTGELAVLAESFSSDQLFLNVFTRNASHNLSNVIQVYGRVPEALLSDAPDGSLIKDRKKFMRRMDFINPQGYLQEMPRQKIITEIAHKRENMLQEFKEIFESSSEEFLSTVEKLNRELDEIQELMLQCHDQYYLRESDDSPNRKHIVLVGTSNPHAGHFEAVTAGDYSFDLSVPIGAEYGTSYDDVDEWSTTCIEIDKILDKDPLSKDDVREACALLEYKMSCIGSEKCYPEKIIELKDRLTELSKSTLLSHESEELSLEDLHAGTLADSIPGGYSVPEAESKFEDIQEVSLPESTKVVHSTMKYGKAIISLKPLGEDGYDLFTEDVEVIVNAANTGMLGGRGIDGAVNKFNAGSGLAKERQNLQAIYGSRIKTGGAFLTAAYNYSQENRDVPPSHDKTGAVISPGGKTPGTVKSIVHAIGPRKPASDEKDTQLALAYKNACLLAHRKGLTSIAFPVLSVGIFNYPVDRAAAALLKGIQNFLDEYPDTSLKDIRVIGEYGAIKAKAEASAEKADNHRSINSFDILSSEVLTGLGINGTDLLASEVGSLGEEVSFFAEGNEKVFSKELQYTERSFGINAQNESIEGEFASFETLFNGAMGVKEQGVGLVSLSVEDGKTADVYLKSTQSRFKEGFEPAHLSIGNVRKKVLLKGHVSFSGKTYETKSVTIRTGSGAGGSGHYQFLTKKDELWVYSNYGNTTLLTEDEARVLLMDLQNKSPDAVVAFDFEKKEGVEADESASEEMIGEEFAKIAEGGELSETLSCALAKKSYKAFSKEQLISYTKALVDEFPKVELSLEEIKQKVERRELQGEVRMTSFEGEEPRNVPLIDFIKLKCPEGLSLEMMIWALYKGEDLPDLEDRLTIDSPPVDLNEALTRKVTALGFGSFLEFTETLKNHGFTEVLEGNQLLELCQYCPDNMDMDLFIYCIKHGTSNTPLDKVCSWDGPNNDCWSAAFLQLKWNMRGALDESLFEIDGSEIDAKMQECIEASSFKGSGKNEACKELYLTTKRMLEIVSSGEQNPADITSILYRFNKAYSDLKGGGFEPELTASGLEKVESGRVGELVKDDLVGLAQIDAREALMTILDLFGNTEEEEGQEKAVVEETKTYDFTHLEESASIYNKVMLMDVVLDKLLSKEALLERLEAAEVTEEGIQEFLSLEYEIEAGRRLSISSLIKAMAKGERAFIPFASLGAGDSEISSLIYATVTSLCGLGGVDEGNKILLHEGYKALITNLARERKLNS